MIIFLFFSGMQRWKPEHVFVCLASGWQCVWLQYFFKNLAPISHVFASHPSSSLLLPNFSHTVAVLSLLSLHSMFSHLNICCDFYLYLTITTSHMWWFSFWFSFLAFEFVLHFSYRHQRVKVLKFLIPLCRDATVGCRKKVLENDFHLQQVFFHSCSISSTSDGR